jgi:hypothetical protein
METDVYRGAWHDKSQLEKHIDQMVVGPTDDLKRLKETIQLRVRTTFMHLSSVHVKELWFSRKDAMLYAVVYGMKQDHYVAMADDGMAGYVIYKRGVDVGAQQGGREWKTITNAMNEVNRLDKIEIYASFPVKEFMKSNGRLDKRAFDYLEVEITDKFDIRGMVRL